MEIPRTPTRIGRDQVYGDHFDNGPGYSTLRRNGGGDWLVMYTLKGAGRIGWEAGGEMRLGPGAYLLYGPDAYQDYSTDATAARWEFLWAHFQPTAEMSSRIARLRNRGNSVWFGQTDNAEARVGVAVAMMRVVSESRSVRRFGQDLALNALEEAFIWIEAIERGGTEGGEAAIDDRIWKATRVLAEESWRPLRVADLAARSGLSPSRFAHLFREQTGMSPMRFLERERLRRASNLLRATGMTVGEVAARTGFDDALYFSRRFKKEFGTAPREWRRLPFPGEEIVGRIGPNG